MRRQIAYSVVLGLLMVASGCNSAPSSPPASYASFTAGTGQWVIAVPGIDPTQAEAVRAAVDGVPGVESGSALVSPGGQYVAFKTTASTSDGQAHGAVRDEVTKMLQKLGLKPGESKTRLW